MINATCIVIVIVSFVIVLAYMVGVHYYIKNAEKNGGNDSGHSHH